MNLYRPRVGLTIPLALALALLACNFGLPAEEPTATARPTQTPKPKATAAEAEPTATRPRPTRTPAPAPTDTPAPQPGDVLYATDFDDLNDWTTIFALPETDNYTTEIRDGTLYIEVATRDTTVYVFNDLIDQADVQIDAAVETVAGPNRNNISLICRATADGWYEFSMNSGGLWWIWRYDDDGFTALAQGGSTAINMQKAKNTLTAVCAGEALILYVNDEEVGSVTDDRFDSGFIGVSVSTFNIQGAGVEFDALSVSLP
jgi:hypothetical protein